MNSYNNLFQKWIEVKSIYLEMSFYRNNYFKMDCFQTSMKLDITFLPVVDFSRELYE